MKKLSILLIALVGAIIMACSNDPKVEAAFVEEVDAQIEKLENGSLTEKLEAAEELSKIADKEEYKDLRNTGEAAKAIERMNKAIENMGK